MVTVEVQYPGAVYHFRCEQKAAEWLVAQFDQNEWVDAMILPRPEDMPPEDKV